MTHPFLVLIRESKNRPSPNYFFIPVPVMLLITYSFVFFTPNASPLLPLLLFFFFFRMTIARSERFLWSFIGFVGGSVACVQTQRTLWRSTSELSDSFLSPPPPAPRSLKKFTSSSSSNPSANQEENDDDDEGFVFGKFAKAKAKRFWNESVDFTFKPIVEYLSKKGY